MSLEKQLAQAYGYIFEEALQREMLHVGVRKQLDKGNMLMDIGDTITHIPLLLDGAIKVMKDDADGDELLLYFIERGDSCAMTFSGCLDRGKSSIRAVAETAVDMLMLPIDKMRDWMGKYPGWQQFVIDSYHHRMMELLEVVDTLAFLPMEERLLKYLQDRALVTHNPELTTTHKEIAEDLHTSRVVVSRLLKKLELQGAIAQQRNKVIVKVL